MTTFEIDTYAGRAPILRAHYNNRIFEFVLDSKDLYQLRNALEDYYKERKLYSAENYKDRETVDMEFPEVGVDTIKLMAGEVRTTSFTGGQKGIKQERFDLIPVEALTLLARLYGVGAMKYDENNWRRGYDWSKSYAALMRHANAFWRGEDIDEETGLPHITSAAWHCFTLMVFMEEQRGFDDRWKPGAEKPDPEIDRNEYVYVRDVLPGEDGFESNIQFGEPIDKGRAVEDKHGIRFVSDSSGDDSNG